MFSTCSQLAAVLRSEGVFDMVDDDDDYVAVIYHKSCYFDRAKRCRQRSSGTASMWKSSTFENFYKEYIDRPVMEDNHIYWVTQLAYILKELLINAGYDSDKTVKTDYLQATLQSIYGDRLIFMKPTCPSLGDIVYGVMSGKLADGFVSESPTPTPPPPPTIRLLEATGALA